MLGRHLHLHVTFVWNFVSLATSVAELTMKKNCVGLLHQSLTQSLTNPAYLMAQEPKNLRFRIICCHIQLNMNRMRWNNSRMMQQYTDNCINRNYECMGGGYWTDWAHALLNLTYLLPSMRLVLVEFCSASSEDRWRKKKTEAVNGGGISTEVVKSKTGGQQSKQAWVHDWKQSKLQTTLMNVCSQWCQSNVVTLRK